MTLYKQPVSVLLVIYTADLEVLLLERADHPGYWQLCTGSCAPGITRNTEHMFGLQLPHPVAVQLAPHEHLSYQWLAWQDAAEKVFSPSNRAAILELSAHMIRPGCASRKMP